MITDKELDMNKIHDRGGVPGVSALSSVERPFI